MTHLIDPSCIRPMQATLCDAVDNCTSENPMLRDAYRDLSDQINLLMFNPELVFFKQVNLRSR